MSVVESLRQRGEIAQKEFEVVIGSDRLVRINVDGICVLRTQLTEGAEVVIADMREPPLQP